MVNFRVNFDTTENLQVDFDSGGGALPLSFGDLVRVVENDYERLDHKPSIENVTLIGDKTFEDLGLRDITNSEIEAIFR